MNQYDKYKDSGVEWLGEIPEHWELKKLKNFCEYVNRGITPAYANEGIKVVNQATFSKGFLDESNIRFSSLLDNQKSILQHNDVLVASTGGGVLGKVFLFNGNEYYETYVADSHVTILRDDKGRFCPSYLYYQLSINYDLINGILAQGSTNQTELQRPWLRSMLFPFPPIEEQESIAKFLDDKCDKIDKAIKQKQQVIVRLNEGRKVVIQRAVTRGLNKDVKLKDSGVDLIGQIPEHWEMKKLKNFCDFVNRGVAPTYADEGIKVVNQATFSKGFFDESNIRFSSRLDNSKSILLHNDILVASTGGGVLGKVFLFNGNEFSETYVADSHVTILRDDKGRFSPSYLYYQLSINYDLINGILAQGSTNQTELQRHWFRTMFFPFPSIEEQKEISKHIDVVNDKIDSIIKLKKQEIEKLKEYKASLINTAVTGKIKIH